MRGGSIIVMAFVALIGACHDRSAPEPETEAHDHAEHDQHEEHDDDAAGANLVRIRPDMLRDLHVTTAPAEQRASGEGVTALGEVRVDETAYAEVGVGLPARVVRVLAAPGETVAVGQPLVTLQSVDVGRARAGLLAAQADASLARTAVERKRQLARDRVVPPREVQEAEAAATAAESSLAAARAALAALGIAATGEEGEPRDTSLFTLYAPLAGAVIERDAVMGRAVEPGHPLFRIADLSRLWLTVHVFERDALRIRRGAEARLSFAALPGQTLTGTVALVGLEVETDSRTIPVRIDLANVESMLRPGMSATAWLPLSDANQLLVAVPTAALQRVADGWAVFIPRGEAQFEMRLVGRGRDLGGEIEVLNGVQAGETVVVDGAFLLKAEAEKARGEGEHHHH